MTGTLCNLFYVDANFSCFVYFVPRLLSSDKLCRPETRVKICSYNIATMLMNTPNELCGTSQRNLLHHTVMESNSKKFTECPSYGEILRCFYECSTSCYSLNAKIQNHL